jgi:hypothetical protein
VKPCRPCERARAFLPVPLADRLRRLESRMIEKAKRRAEKDAARERKRRG